MNTTQQTRRAFPAIITTVLLVTLGALPATARQDSGPATHTATVTYLCAVQRVGTQFVACDNLTGNGVPAPAWVQER